MRLTELTAKLRQPYESGRGYGVEKVPNPGYENIWFVVPPRPPTSLGSSVPLGAIRDANRVLQDRPALHNASDEQQLMSRLLLRREAVASSRMEGTWSTIDDVLTPHNEESNRSATASVRGYAHGLRSAMQRLEEGGPAALTIDLICMLHKQVVSKDPTFNGVPGQIRTPGEQRDVVQIGPPGRKEDSIYNPAPPMHTKRCLDDVVEWMTDPEFLEASDAGMGLSLPIRMAIGHSHFEAVHPFSDGNGRVGRMLWAMQMAMAGRLPLYLSSYVEVYKADYGDALADAQKQLNYSAIIEFVCNAIVECAAEEKTTEKALSALPAVWAARGKLRAGSSGARALPLLKKMPIMTVQVLSEELEVSVQAADTALKQLANLGIVRDRTGKGRRRIYAAEEVIALLSRPFGAATAN